MSQSRRIIALLTLALLALAFGVSATAAGSPAAETNAGVTVSGRVYYDLGTEYGDFDEGEPGVLDAVVELRDSAGNPVQGQDPVITIDTNGGVFTFTNVLSPGSYQVSVSGVGVSNAIFTSPNPITVTVAGASVEPVNFGIVLKRTIGGRVYTDLTGDGEYTPYNPNKPYDTVLAGATVRIIDDRNGNGRMDAGEPKLGEGVSSTSGIYKIVPDILPGGKRIMTVIPAEPGAVWGDPAPFSLPAVEYGSTADINVPVVASTPADQANLVGTVWNDIDGDEIIEAGEPGVAGVRLELYVVGEQPQEATLLTSATTDATGHYQVNGMYAAWSYEIRPVTTTLPAGWIMSNTDPTLLFVPPSATGSTNTVNVGYYDPLSTAPMRQGDWKKELKQAGKPRYTPAQIDGFVASAEASSGVFAEVVGIREVLLKSPVQGDLGQALKEYAALRLNLASSRLYAATPVHLPELTTATTVGAAVVEIEVSLAPGRTPAPTKDEYQRVRKLAEAINKGTGLGSGKTAVWAPAYATYRGTSVVSKLRPAGDIVELGMDEPAYLRNWSNGTLDPATNVFSPQVRFKIKTFIDGGVLDVVQKLPNGSTVLLGTIVHPVWNKDVNATYTLDLRGMSTAAELTSTEIRLVVRDISADGKPARVRIDSAELVFKY